MRKSFTWVVLVVVCALAGVAAAQYPSGALLRLDAGAETTSTGGRLTQWSDASKNGVAFVAPDTASRPYVGAANINGHPVITFLPSGSYLEGPHLFPVSQDYTVVMVMRITNFGVTNNIVSGTTHATYFGGATSIRFLHGNFNTQAVSSAPLSASPAVVIGRFRQSTQNAGWYVNGQDGDSSLVGTNTDSTIYLGCYQRGNFMSGDIAEVLIYPRFVSDIERRQLEDTLFKKYGITGPQPPDTTFSEVPKRLGFYARDEDDSATVGVKGTLRAIGFDSVYLRAKKNGVTYSYSSVPLTSGKPFALNARIHAELSEYSFTIGAKGSDKDSVLRQVDSVVCGEAILIDGQSNSIFGLDTYTNEYCRTFGGNFSSSKADTAWSLSVGYGTGGGSNVGAFGLEIQRDYAERMHLPTALITGSVGGTAIEQHLPNANNPTDLSTIYGSMLYRVRKAGLVNKAKALFWYQGESNSITNYFDNFKKLSNSWRIDYPAVKKFYVVQVRPGCAAPGNSSELRDLLRSLSRYYLDVVTHTTMGLPDHDGCHFIKAVNGYHMLGDQLFALVERDLYHSTDTIGINSPDILSARYTDETHTSITLLFNTGGSGMNVPADSMFDTLRASIKDYFYVGTDTSLVSEVTAHGDTILLKLKHSTNARTIAYLPDTYYNNTTITYEGPWLRNNNGLGAFCFWGVPITYVLRVGEATTSGTDLSVIPNPASDHSLLSFELGERARVRLSVYDETGRELLRPVDETREAGRYTLDLDTRSLPTSSLVCRLESNGYVIERRLIVTH
ncbi:MAG: hypothetical protein JSS75_01185 [Bacteroidetes bacterium]|nr:hypothetical protein [Bacteroidota bacterium]